MQGQQTEMVLVKCSPSPDRFLFNQLPHKLFLLNMALKNIILVQFCYF